MVYLGNKDILKIQKTGFLCSRKCPAEIVLKSYEWAKHQRIEGNCIVCGNHSQIEKDVFEILLRGNQPLILVLARGMKKRWDILIHKALKENRLLIISLFPEKENRVTHQLAEKRNRFIFDLCEKTHIPYAQPNGLLEKLIKETI
jgi:predicted Rossmann fold nucleotide-binding protein DprA/Smf involved in DNA uptake